jgi:hypothetical protein
MPNPNESLTDQMRQHIDAAHAEALRVARQRQAYESELVRQADEARKRRGN